MSKRGRNEKCAYCRRTLEAVTSLSKVAATRDHILPKSRGGTRTIWCCRQCNGLKGNMTPWQWVAFMAQNPEWWKAPQFQRGTISKNSMTMTEAARLANAHPAFASGYYVAPQPSNLTRPTETLARLREKEQQRQGARSSVDRAQGTGP